MHNQFGKESCLYLKTEALNGKTYLKDLYFTAPLKIAKPFYEDTDDLMSIMVMTASAGVMEGDSYRIDAKLGKGSRVILGSQSYQKIHRMKDGHADQHSFFVLEEGAFLDYAPRPTIPFNGSCFYTTTECRMAEGSAFLYSEILAGGRVKSGETFQFKEYRSGTSIYYGKELIFLENQFLCPKEQSLAGIGFFEGYTHQASMGFFNDHVDDELIDNLYEILEGMDDVQFGISKTKKYGLVLRILGSSSDELESILCCIKKEIYRHK
jgi:urease accessory protein